MSLNILVIDDDVSIVERLINNLKRADESGYLGSVCIDDSIMQLESIERYDVSRFNTSFDVALIDYQLSSSFTGILVSAWVALYLRIPRLTLTTAAYPGNPDYFNGSILKDELNESPRAVISKIINCVENFNAELWLNKQYQNLVIQYQRLLADESSESNLNEIESLLDRFEKILDVQQETEMKKAFQYEHETSDFIQKEKSYEEMLSNLNEKLNDLMKEISNNA